MSSLQTARVTGKKEFGLAIGIGGFISPDDDDELSLSKFAFYEGNLRYGIAQNWDIGVEIGIPALLFFDAKHQFVGDRTSKLACSYGLGLGLNPWGENLFDGFGVLLPFYASYHPNQNIAMYASPRMFSSFGKESKSSHMIGSSFGLRLGNITALVVEYSIYTYLYEDSEHVSQVMAALSFNIP